MILNRRRREYLSRLVGYATSPVAARARLALGREQQHEINGAPVVLPPDHLLPYYQHRDPTYDTYANDIVAALAEELGGLHVVDIGANVGDTAVGALAAHPSVTVTSVEGDPRFAAYLRRNTAPYGTRAEAVEGFVGPVGDRTTFTRSGTNGGFGAPSGTGEELEVSEWVSPADLVSGHPTPVLYKSDVEGFDVHVLVAGWEAVDRHSEVLWFEFDPVGTLGDREDVDRLADLLDGSGRTVQVFDNLGRPLVTFDPGAVGTGLRSVARWLAEQRRGHVLVPYVDVWAFSPRTAHLAGPAGAAH